MLNFAPGAEPRIIRDVLNGRRERFGLLVDRYLPSVYAVALARLRNHADAEDAAQETFLQALRSLNTLREPGKFENWIVTIARNTAHRVSTNRTRNSETLVALQREGEAPSEPLSAANAELRQILHTKLDQLDPDHREVLLLHYFAGKKTREIAATLAISQDAVKKRLQRAREALTEKLLPEIPEATRPAKPLTDQAKTIAALALAASVDWRSAAGLAAGATANAFSLSPSLIGAAAVIVALAGIATYRLLASEPPIPAPTTPPPPPVEVAQQTPAPPPIQTSIRPQINFEYNVDLRQRDATAASSATFAPPSDALLRKLHADVSLVFETIHIDELLEFVSDTFDIAVTIDFDVVARQKSEPIQVSVVELNEPDRTEPPKDLGSYSTDGMLAEINIVDKPLLEVLVGICEPLGLDIVEEPGYIWVSSPERIRAEIKRKQDERYDAYPIEETLNQSASAVFKNIHIDEVFEFLTDTFEVPIAIDYRVVAPQDFHHPPDQLPTGIVTNGIVPKIALNQIQIADALPAILRPLNLAFVATGDRIVITTPERIANNQLPPED